MCGAHVALDRASTVSVCCAVDGTLTEPVIDFAKMRRVVGVPDGEDTLDFLAGLAPDVRTEREAALHAVEAEGMAQMRLMPGARELARFLDSRGVPRCVRACVRRLIPDPGRAVMALEA